MHTLADCKTKKAQIEFIKNQLVNNDRWMLRGLIAIYNRQTAAERSSNTTTEHNGVGFTGIDGNILSSFAQQVINRGALPILRNKHEHINATRFLSPKQVGLLKAKMPKYAKQLHMISQHG